jgi:hypothetical protein
LFPLGVALIGKGKQMKLHALAFGVFVLAAACAPTAQTASNASSPAGKDCFNAGFISGYNTVSDRTVRVTAGVSHDYDLDIDGPGCRDIKWTNSIAIVSRPSAWICAGDKVGAGDVKFRDSTRGVTSCYITDVRRYVKPATAALPATQ